MLVRVNCRAPKYIRGQYTFDSLEKLYNFLSLIRSVSKDALSTYIFSVAKDGRLILSKYGLSLDITLDSPDYFLANKLAEGIGLIGSWQKFKPNTKKALDFAKAFDSSKARAHKS
jgi:hypothetical protein